MSQQHLSADQISDLVEGILPAAEAMGANAHLATCDECSSLRDDVTNVSLVLAGEAARPWQMPADVASDLDALLRQAAADRGTGVVPLEKQVRRQNRGLAWLAGAAAAVVIAGVGFAGWQAVSGGAGTTQNAATTPSKTFGPSPTQGNTQQVKHPRCRFKHCGSNVHPILAVTAAHVPLMARTLATHPESRVAPGSVGCQVPVIAGVSSVVTWHGQHAVLVANAETHKATILDCDTASLALFSTTF